MSRAFDFVVIGVIWSISVCIHIIGINLFAPGTPLYETAASASTLNGGERAQLWFEILVIWVPMISTSGITAWGVIREYRRQAVTSVQGI